MLPNEMKHLAERSYKMKKFARLTGEYEQEYFNTPAMRANEGRMHPLVSFALMTLLNNGAFMVLVYMWATRFSVLGVAAVALLLLSSFTVYTTS